MSSNQYSWIVEWFDQNFALFQSEEAASIFVDALKAAGGVSGGMVAVTPLRAVLRTPSEQRAAESA